MTKPALILDLEIYHDYFLAAFRNVATGNVRHFEMFDGQALDLQTLRAILTRYQIITFNGAHFDLPLLSFALSGANCAQLKRACDAIIQGNLRSWELEKQFGFKTVTEIDHIDLIEVAPGVASLKIYAGRLHAQRMQDLPIEPDASIEPDDRQALRTYCANDLANTQALHTYLLPQLELRERMSADYKIDLRSKSDAQIAEAVIGRQVGNLLGEEVTRPAVCSKTFCFKAPSFVCFATDSLRKMVDMVQQARFLVSDTGKVIMPEELTAAAIRIGAGTYRMGIGGLHSSEQSTAHLADENTLLVDRDVTSYYPSIILCCGLAPTHMGRAFTKVYQGIVDARLQAKRAGDKVTADALKITINGSFGKFGSMWSKLYSPDLLIQTTITGQLCLLMLIEALQAEGIPVVSANTDGIVIKCPTALVAIMEFVVWDWEEATGFETEATYYRALYSRDVNNYVAIKTDGSVKLKGAYAPAGLQKNPANDVCVGAVVKHLTDGTSLEDTILACADVRRFVTIRQVKGGALDQEGSYLGKAVRWYYARGVTGALTYKINGYTVPRSEGARALMELPQNLPADVDHAWYIREAHAILADIGAPQQVMA